MSLLDDPVANHYASLRAKIEKNQIAELVKLVNETKTEVEFYKSKLEELDNIFIEFKKQVPVTLNILMEMVSQNPNITNEHLESQIANLANVMKKYRIFKNKDPNIYNFLSDKN